MFLMFMGDGTIRDGNGDSLGTYSTLDWIKVKLKYERPTASTVRVTYWIDDMNEGSVTYAAHAEEDNLGSLDLTVQEGTVWFDDVKVTD